MAFTEQDLQKMAQAASFAAGASRSALAEAQAARGEAAALKQMLAQSDKNFQSLQAALSRVQVQSRVGDPNIQRVENIPGRRIPFDLLVDIAIPAASTAVQQGTIQVDQTGPFVAVARYAAFVSTYQFQVTPPFTTTTATFNGRSFGRYRPIHSVWDLNDGQPVSSVALAQAFPGTGAPHIASPANASPWRSMEMDFRILMREAGSSFPRSFIETPVPSPLWVKGLNDPFELGALDFFERGEVLQFNVLPLHQANPAGGNLSSYAAIPPFPFIDSQWDAVEGINDQAQVLAESETDPVVRFPQGILTIGFHGYRIYQPAGAGQY